MKRASERAAGGGELRPAAGDCLDGVRQTADQRGVVGQERDGVCRLEHQLIGKRSRSSRPERRRLDGPPDAPRDLFLQRLDRPDVVEADVEGDLHLGRHDIGGAVAGLDRGDLQIGGLEAFVARRRNGGSISAAITDGATRNGLSARCG